MESIEKEIQKNNWKILANLSEFEGFREEIYKKKLFYEILAILSPAAGITIMFMLIFSIFDKSFPINTDVAFWLGCGLMFASIGISAILAIASRDLGKDFKSKIKNSCLKDVLKAFGDIEWIENKSKSEIQESNTKLSSEVLERSALFANYNRRYIDDEFIGRYKGVDFDISESHLQYISGSGKNRTVVDIFKGVIIQFDSNKKVLNRTMVATKGDLKTGKTSTWVIILASVVPVIRIMADSLKDGFNIFALIIPVIFIVIFLLLFFMNKKKEEPLNEVTLEDPEFNKKFNVYSSDQVEARYLITPSFMERLNNLTTAFGCKNVKCSFFDDKFMVAISTNKDLFEIGKLNTPLSNPETLEMFYKELNSIYEMIDYFKLDEKTGL